MHTIGEYIGAQRTIEGELVISFAVDDEVLDKMQGFDSERVTLDVQRFRDKRSNQANAYFWQMASQIGRALGASKDTIYEMKLKDYGVFTDYVVPVNASEALSSVFRFTEPQYYFITEIVRDDGNTEPLNMVCLRCWKGSHQYNTKEMSDLINGTVNDANDLGIDTWTRQEIDQALRYWEAQ